MKNKTKKVALYDPYLDTLGGGEKYILSILEVFAEQGYEISIFWDKNLTKEIKKRFAFRFIDTSKYLPSIFKNKKYMEYFRDYFVENLIKNTRNLYFIDGNKSIIEVRNSAIKLLNDI